VSQPSAAVTARPPGAIADEIMGLRSYPAGQQAGDGAQPEASRPLSSSSEAWHDRGMARLRVCRGFTPGASRSRAGCCGDAKIHAHRLTVMESLIRGGPPLHVHHHEDESFYVLDGRVTVRCGGDVFEAGPRSFVFQAGALPFGAKIELQVVAAAPDPAA
jgi:mannose-6-phosphate isomerase-like protein (cupin superfamily)